MKRRFRSRPSPGISILAAIVGVFMLIFAAVVFSQVNPAPGPLNGPASIFVVVWFLALIGIIIYHVINATRPGGVPTSIVESQDEDVPSGTTANRLQELEDLRKQKLISDSEYETKRQEILKKL